MASTDELAFDAPAGGGVLDAMHELLARAWSSHPDVDDVTRDHLTTALGEIAGNVVEHAPTASTVRIAIEVTSHAVRAELVDDGEALSPTVVEDATWPDDPLATSGRGIALARDALDELVYRREGERNHWSLLRRR